MMLDINMSDSFIVPQNTELDYKLSLSDSLMVNGVKKQITTPENSYWPLQNGNSISFSSSYTILDSSGSVVDPTKIKDKNFVVNCSIISTEQNSVPNGLTYSFSSNTYTLSGTVSDISYKSYSTIIRFSLQVFDSNNNLLGENFTDTNITFWTKENDQISFYWDSDWLARLPVIKFSDGSFSYVIAQVGKGAYINNSVIIYSNQDITGFVSYNIKSSNLTLPQTYSFNGDTITPTTPQINNKPNNISIKNNGIFGGSISPITEPGYYFFSISAAAEINGQIYYGTPNTNLNTGNVNFCIIVGDYYEYNYSNDITWVTPSGNLGSIYEGYPSYFSVKATSNTGDVIYSLSPYSSLPDGMYVDPNGYICGTVPYSSYNTFISFSIRVNVQNIYSDRTFSFEIIPTYNKTEQFFNLKIPMYSTQIKKIQNIQNLITKNIYRNPDSNYGIVDDFDMYFVSGLSNTDDITGYWDTTLDSKSSLYGVGQNKSVITSANSSSYSYCLADKLRNYHRPYSLRIGELASTKMYSNDNVYLCDVVYFNVYDKHGGNESFNNGVEILHTNPNTPLLSFVNYDNNFFSKRIFTPSLSNCRNDLILTTNRINTPTRMLRPNATAGIGIVGSEEALPTWMRNSAANTKPIGFVPAIVIAYMECGYGDKIVKTLKSTNEYSSIVGEEWLVDRYIFESKIPEPANISTIFQNQNTTIFDMEYYYSKSYTYFDNGKTIFDTDTTQFDVVDGFNETYLFFPKEIINDIEY